MFCCQGNRIVRSLRAQLFSSIVRQEIAFFDMNKTGELINRLSTDTTLVGQSVTMNISDGLRSVVQALAGISMMVRWMTLSHSLLEQLLCCFAAKPHVFDVLFFLCDVFFLDKLRLLIELFVPNSHFNHRRDGHVIFAASRISCHWFHWWLALRKEFGQLSWKVSLEIFNGQPGKLALNWLYRI